MEHLDEIEARSGPSAKRRLFSMHSSEGADSEGGNSLDSLSLQDFQGGASEGEKEEGAAPEEEEDFTIRDDMAIMKNNLTIIAEMHAEGKRRMAEMAASNDKMGETMDRTIKKWRTPPR